MFTNAYLTLASSCWCRDWFILFIVISQNLADPFLQENLLLLRSSAPSSASATMLMMTLTKLENLNRFPV
jgi:hypothetical protein